MQLGAGSALALLVARVLADDHDSAVATDHLALVTHLADARLDLHEDGPFTLFSAVTCRGRRSGPECARTARVPPLRGPRGGSGCSAGDSCRRFPRAPCGRCSAPSA